MRRQLQTVILPGGYPDVRRWRAAGGAERRRSKVGPRINHGVSRASFYCRSSSTGIASDQPTWIHLALTHQQTTSCWTHLGLACRALSRVVSRSTSTLKALDPQIKNGNRDLYATRPRSPMPPIHNSLPCAGQPIVCDITGPPTTSEASSSLCISQALGLNPDGGTKYTHPTSSAPRPTHQLTHHARHRQIMTNSSQHGGLVAIRARRHPAGVGRRRQPAGYAVLVAQMHTGVLTSWRRPASATAKRGV